jgi:hypothetical protein
MLRFTVWLVAVVLIAGSRLATCFKLPPVAIVRAPFGTFETLLLHRATTRQATGSSRPESCMEDRCNDPVSVDSCLESESGPGLETLDPEVLAVEQQEEGLKEELSSIDETLRNQRLRLAKLRDRISESGKNGFFIVQAQVNDFAVSVPSQTYHIQCVHYDHIVT